MKEKIVVPIKVLQIDVNEFIPFWELTVEHEDNCGIGYKVKDDWHTHYNDLQDAFYDLETKEISFGIVKEVYPDKTEYALNETVYYEVKHHRLKEAKIIDIVYEEYETRIAKYERLESYEKKYYFKDGDEIQNGMYEIRTYKPTYILSTGERVKYDHQLNHKAE